jgi:uncharacterized protein (TIGR00299 family) protein
MKVLYYDCFSGISGDMNLGAMIDLGVDAHFLVNELNKLNLKGWELISVKDQRHGIEGTKVTIRLTRNEHAHRHLSDIEKIINGSDLNAETKKLSLRIFSILAEAEAKVHGISVNEVHFHEVGAVDSIIDIVGAAVCFNALRPDAVFVSTVELGGGMVKCDHGLLPVPAPATAEILKNIAVRKDGVGFEATTPTGAAILATLATRFGTMPEFRIEKTGYGVGQKDHPDVPNLLRVFIGEAEEKSPGHDALLLECNIDDMNPEFYEFISEKLFSAGAADVYISNVLMKKGRPGNILSVICEKGIADKIKDVIFSESTTAGIRTFPFRKDTLARSFEAVATPYGDVTVKRTFHKGVEVSCKPEFEECKKIAKENNLPVKIVYSEILAILTNLKK